MPAASHRMEVIVDTTPKQQTLTRPHAHKALSVWPWYGAKWWSYCTVRSAGFDVYETLHYGRVLKKPRHGVLGLKKTLVHLYLEVRVTYKCLLLPVIYLGLCQTLKLKTSQLSAVHDNQQIKNRPFYKQYGLSRRSKQAASLVLQHSWASTPIQKGHHHLF